MAVPKFYEFFNVFLDSLQDGKVHHIKECRQYILQNMNLSDADLAKLFQVENHEFGIGFIGAVHISKKVD